MGYKGTLRALGSMARQANRESIRRQKLLEKQRALYQKMAELEQAAFEVEEYENLIERMITLHKDSSARLDWKEISQRMPPAAPINRKKREKSANEILNSYVPSFWDKLFKSNVKKIAKLQASVKQAIDDDAREFSIANIEYKQKLEEYEEMLRLSKSIMAGDLDAFKEALDELNPFSEISELGSSLDFDIINTEAIRIKLNAHEEKVIPRQAKTLLKSGKLSVKELPVSRFNEIYQDFICSAVIRISKEIFALLPLSTALITVNSKLLNTKTGKLELVPILSAKIVKETLDSLNMELIDPSDSMNNFVHNMNFKKTTGFNEVKELV